MEVDMEKVLLLCLLVGVVGTIAEFFPAHRQTPQR
jgi:hypothetical protein